MNKAAQQPVLVTPVNIVRAQTFDSFTKVHMDFLLIVAILVLVIVAISRFETSPSVRTPPNLHRSQGSVRGTRAGS